MKLEELTKQEIVYDQGIKSTRVIMITDLCLFNVGISNLRKQMNTIDLLRLKWYFMYCPDYNGLKWKDKNKKYQECIRIPGAWQHIFGCTICNHGNQDGNEFFEYEMEI